MVLKNLPIVLKKHLLWKKAAKQSAVIYLVFLSCVTIPPNYEKARIKPLIQGHSHNDYDRKNPLVDAIVLGFQSIEADIHLKDGELYVAHDEEDIDKTKTLESMYLRPLEKLAKRHNGYLYKDNKPILLLIDIKTDADSTYLVLDQTLSNYKDLLSSYNNNREKKGPVKVIISGERAIFLMQNQNKRFAAVDGRLADLETGMNKTLVPLISDKWTDAFTWKGLGEMPAQELKKLSTIVSIAHNEGRLIRFWDTDSDTKDTRHAMWRMLLETNVDLINTDYIEDFYQFLDREKNLKNDMRSNE